MDRTQLSCPFNVMTSSPVATDQMRMVLSREQEAMYLPPSLSCASPSFEPPAPAVFFLRRGGFSPFFSAT